MRTTAALSEDDRGFQRFAKILWAGPCSAIGLVLAGVALLSGGRCRTYAGVLEVTLPERSRPGASGRFPFRAVVFGHVILAVSSQELPRLRAHEHAHVRQYERWGILFFPAYAAAGAWQWLKGRQPYWDNAFEVQAREQAALSNSACANPDRSIIRTATLADCVALASLAGQLGYPTSETEMRQRLSGLLSWADHVVFVAEAGIVIGWIHAGAVALLESAPFVEIFGLVVSAEHRNQGTGAALITTVEQWASARGYSKVRVRSNATRSSARRFYERHGYRISKIQNVFDKPLPPQGVQ